MDQVETYGAPTLTDVEFNSDGTLKQSGKQNVKFYNKKLQVARARVKTDEAGVPVLDEKGKQIPIIDPRTGIPFKDYFPTVVEFCRVESKGDTNIIDDVATEFQKRQFYRQYKSWREGRIPDGNPIEDFEFIQPSAIVELHMIGIHVIQQVALMNDLECEQLKDQSGYELRDVAAQWVKINSPDGQSAHATRLEMEVAKLQRELEDSKKNERGGMRAVQPEIQVVPETPVATMEVDLKARPRKV